MKKTGKFWLMYNVIVFAVYFIISTVLFFHTGNDTWILSFQTVPVWIIAFFFSFLITYVIRKL